MLEINSMYCVACDSSCSGEIYLAKSYVDSSYGRFCQCTACGTLNVIDSIDYDSLYSNRKSTNYPTAHDNLLNKAFSYLKQYYLSLKIPDLLKGLPTTATILDYGCGSGDLANAAYRYRPGLVFAADVQADRPKTLLEDIEYFQISKIPQNIKVDLVVMRHVLEHIQDPVRALTSIARQLTPKGQIIIEVPSERSVFRRWLGARWPGYFFPYHVYVFSEKGMRFLVARSGLEIIGEAPCNPPIMGVLFEDLGLNRSVSRLLSIMLYPFQWLLNRSTNGPEAFMVRVQVKSNQR
ncbi:MAG: class I SAM-dependent methyltransferase [Burkholderiaceae bacterium]